MRIKEDKDVFIVTKNRKNEEGHIYFKKNICVCHDEMKAKNMIRGLMYGDKHLTFQKGNIYKYEKVKLLR